MAPVTNFLQLMGQLTGMRQQQQQLDDAWDRHQEQIRQFNKVQGTKELYDAVDAVQKLPADARGDFLVALAQTDPTLAEKLQGFSRSMMEAPQYQQQRDVQAGRAAMAPQQLGAAQQEAYLRQMTGGGAGQLAASTAQAGAIQGAQTSMNPQQLGAANEAYMLRMLAGQTPEQFQLGQSLIQQNLIPGMARQQAGVELSLAQKQDIALRTGQLELGWANLNQGDRQLAQQYDIHKDQIEAGKYASKMQLLQQGRLDPKTMLDISGVALKILEDLEKDTADKNTNMGRARVWNQIVAPVMGITLPEDGTLQPVDAKSLRVRVMGGAGIGAPVSMQPPAPTSGAVVRGGTSNWQRGQ